MLLLFMLAVVAVYEENFSSRHRARSQVLRFAGNIFLGRNIFFIMQI